LKRLMSGNSAVGEAAVLAGCTCYFGYPITPQNELTEYMAKRIAEVPGGVFIQSESEIAAINMVLGASAAGARAMTSSSGPGISLKQEGVSYLAADELPAVIVNMMRGGPGMGNISPAQSDYLQATRGGGHGDYTIVLAPASVQEAADLVHVAFDLADTYRNPLVVLGDGMLGQMMEPVTFTTPAKKKEYPKEYVLTGASGRPARMIRSLLFDTKEEEEHNWKLFRKYQLMEQNEVRYETFLLDDADMALLAYGIAARIAKGAIKRLRQEGLRVGLIRPITLWPFPKKIIQETAKQLADFFVFEMSTGQMIEDVKLALEGKGHVHFYGRPGGVIPTPVELSRIVARHYYQSKQGKKT